MAENLQSRIHEQYEELFYRIQRPINDIAVEFVEYGGGVGGADLTVLVEVLSINNTSDSEDQSEYARISTWNRMADIVANWLFENGYDAPESLRVSMTWPASVTYTFDKYAPLTV